jgi:hypothetical protein
MPTHIYCNFDENNPFNTVGGFGEGEDAWDLSSQINMLEQWLSTHFEDLDKGSYVADIGFTLAKDACGGGAVMSKNLIAMLHKVGMEVYFSEYWLS